LGLEGASIVALKRPRSPKNEWPDELKNSVRAARFCGEWFNLTETHMAFELLGIGG
jgi:hypothetical protein